MNDNNERFVDVNTDDLDDFNALMHGNAKPIEVDDSASDNTGNDADDDQDNQPEEDFQESQDEAPEEDSLATDEEPEAEAEAETEAEEAKADPPKNKKSRYQERINDLLAKAREAEERERQANARLEEILTRLEKNVPKPEEKSEEAGPSPDDRLENGEDKYPLGEFDPQYLRDVARHEVRKETEAARQEAAAERERAAKEAELARLSEDWNVKLEKARDTYPDLDEKNEVLIDMFSGVDQSLGEFIATTVMTLDYGTDVLYHLANHPAEAKTLLSSSPAKAAITLGRLDARFALNAEEKEEKAEQKKLKVSNAPTPPERFNKGTSVSKTLPPDTDDLDGFSDMFFKTPKYKRK